MIKIRGAVILAIMAVVSLAACDGQGAGTTEAPVVETAELTTEVTVTPTEEPTTEPTPSELTLTSAAFENGGEIPERYGFYQDNVSPPLTWVGTPNAAQTLVLIMEDRYQETPEGPPCHWMLYNIPRYVNTLPEGVPAALTFTDATVQAANLNGEHAYAGPFPPLGERHEYVFTLYALRTMVLGLPFGATCDEVRQIIEDNEDIVLASTELIGWYEGVAP